MPYADSEKRKEFGKKYREMTREEAKIYARKYNHTDKTRNRKYLKTYGITLDDYNRMLEEQNHACKICLQPEVIKVNGKVKRLSVDHCHKTGKVRGLLCQRCNTTLGQYEDNPVLMKNLISYLLSVV